MRSLISIYNMALARLGGNQFDRLNTPDEENAVATLCRTLYPHVLEMALAHSEWAFARKSARLALKPEQEPDPYAPFRHALPADCIRPVELRDAGEAPVPFAISGRDVLSAVADASLSYVARLDDPSAWPPAFADAVAWGLAAELSTALVNDARRQQAYTQQARQALDYAAAVERNSQKPRRPASPWLASRG